MSDVLGYALAIVISFLGGGMIGWSDQRENIADHCNNFGAFMHDGHKYECRQVKP